MLVGVIREKNFLIPWHYRSNAIFRKEVSEHVVFKAVIREILRQLRGVSVVDPHDTMLLIEFVHLGAINHWDLIWHNLSIISEEVIPHPDKAVLDVHQTRPETSEVVVGESGLEDIHHSHDLWQVCDHVVHWEDAPVEPLIEGILKVVQLMPELVCLHQSVSVESTVL